MESPGARRMASPEQLNDYLKVTNPKIWVLLTAIILLIVGLLLWSSFTTIESYATGTARAVGGELTVKRLDRRGGRTLLVPANPAYPEFDVTDREDLCIWGVVTYAVHKL